VGSLPAKEECDSKIKQSPKNNVNKVADELMPDQQQLTPEQKQLAQ
jgi:hypothetical protein